MTKNKSIIRSRHYTNADIMAEIEAMKVDRMATKKDSLSTRTDLTSLIGSTKTELMTAIETIKTDAAATKTELVSLIVDVRNDLKQDISWLDHKIANVDKKIDSVEARLERKIDQVDLKLDANTNDIIGVLQDFMGLTDDRFNNHERRYV